MLTSPHYAAVKIRGYALVDSSFGTLTCDLIGGSVTHAVNSIPRAQFNLALGREASAGLASNAHLLVGDSLYLRGISVFLRITPQSSSLPGFFQTSDRWPAQDFTWFEGFVDSTSAAISRDGQVSFSVGAIGWLYALNFATALSRKAVVAGAVAAANYLPRGPRFSGRPKVYVKPSHVYEDIWGKTNGADEGIGGYFREAASALDPQFAGDLLSHQRAVAALNRFEPFARGGQGGGGSHPNPNTRYNHGYRFAPPLCLHSEASSAVLQKAAARALDDDLRTNVAFDSERLVRSVWDALIGQICPQLHLSVIPLVNTALLVPQNYGRRRPWQVIYDQEYNQLRWLTSSTRPIRNCVLVGNTNDAAGGPNGVRLAQASRATIAGRFTALNRPEGFSVSGRLPSWVCGLIRSDRAADNSGVNEQKNSAVNPDATTGNPAPAVPSAAALQEQAKPICDAFAALAFVQESLRGRMLNLSGKLRFDIAPGSTVAVQVNQERFVESQMQQLELMPKFGVVVVGEVTQVTCTIDVQAETAMTAFNIDAVRTIQENNASPDGVQVMGNLAQVGNNSLYIGHPLWRWGWCGAPLADANPELWPVHTRLSNSSLPDLRYRPDSSGDQVDDDTMNGRGEGLPYLPAHPYFSL